MVVRWSSRAERVVEQQYCWYLETSGQRAADKFRQGVIDDAMRIGSNPEIGRIEELLQGVSSHRVWRSLVSGRRYKIVYFTQDQIVYITYVWTCEMKTNRLISIIKKRG